MWNSPTRWYSGTISWSTLAITGFTMLCRVEMSETATKTSWINGVCGWHATYQAPLHCSSINFATISTFELKQGKYFPILSPLVVVTNFGLDGLATSLLDQGADLDETQRLGCVALALARSEVFSSTKPSRTVFHHYIEHPLWINLKWLGCSYNTVEVLSLHAMNKENCYIWCGRARVRECRSWVVSIG